MEQPGNYFVMKNGLYLCFDKRWTEKICWAIRFSDPEQADLFAEMKRGHVVELQSEEIIEALGKEMNMTVRLAMKQFGESLRHMN